MTERHCYTVGFCGQYVTINTYDRNGAELVEFLCCDFMAEAHDVPRASYDLLIAETEPMMSLCQGERQLYRGTCKYQLAYELINEIIHQCIVDNNRGFAIHAAAINGGNADQGGILLPGKSGSGKTTFTTWLVAKGNNYLTDELVIIDESDHRIHSFTRPLSIKSGSAPVISSFLDYKSEEVISGREGFMLPHRSVNSTFVKETPTLSLILFPEYKAGAVTELIQLSGAQGCAELLSSYVNARNIQGHGFSGVAALTRTTPCYKLKYGSFDGLYEKLHTSFSDLFIQKIR